MPGSRWRTAERIVIGTLTFSSPLWFIVSFEPHAGAMSSQKRDGGAPAVASPQQIQSKQHG
jgi:hypothetical protein